MPRGLTLLLTLILASSGLVPAAAGQVAARLSLDELLARVGETVEHYYERAQSLMCVETVSQQPLRYDLMPEVSFPRRLVFERRIEWDPSVDGAAPEARVRRELLRVNNRAPRPKDKPQCFDPAPSSSDTMQMLLPVNRDDYVFTAGGVGKIDGHPAIMIDYRERHEGPIDVRMREGVEGCFFVDMPGRSRGRIWIEPDTFNVLRIDERLAGPVSIRRTARQLKSHADIDVTFERLESTITYRPVTFTEPEETLLLPASVVSTQVQTGHRQRETRTYTDYRRFVTEGRIVEE